MRPPGAPPTLLENCHDDDGLPTGNAPHRDDYGALWCPFHLYRVSGDAGSLYGMILQNLNSTRQYAAQNLSVPGCWAYADMLEVGVTNTQLHICGPAQNETCAPLTVTESRTHFGAWAIVSSPLVLSFDFANSTNLDVHWPTVTNRDALAVHAAYAGFSGGLFFESDDETEFSPCGFRAGLTCSWPRLMSWYKPLGGDDSRGSTMAVLLMNNGDGPTTLSFSASSPLPRHMLSLLATPILADISSLLRRALLSESEQAEAGVLPPNLLLDYSLLHREIEDSTGRPRTAAIRRCGAIR